MDYKFIYIVLFLNIFGLIFYSITWTKDTKILVSFFYSQLFRSIILI